MKLIETFTIPLADTEFKITFAIKRNVFKRICSEQHYTIAAQSTEQLIANMSLLLPTTFADIRTKINELCQLPADQYRVQLPDLQREIADIVYEAKLATLIVEKELATRFNVKKVAHQYESQKYFAPDPITNHEKEQEMNKTDFIEYEATQRAECAAIPASDADNFHEDTCTTASAIYKGWNEYIDQEGTGYMPPGCVEYEIRYMSMLERLFQFKPELSIIGWHWDFLEHSEYYPDTSFKIFEALQNNPSSNEILEQRLRDREASQKSPSAAEIIKQLRCVREELKKAA